MDEEDMRVSPIYSVAAALQDIVIALERLGSALPVHDRATFDAGTRRIRLARDELLDWCDKVVRPREAE